MTGVQTCALPIYVTSSPHLLMDYENCEQCCMNGPQVANGCDYIFKRGPRCSFRCGIQTVESKPRCKFHDHIIFQSTTQDQDTMPTMVQQNTMPVMVQQDTVPQQVLLTPVSEFVPLIQDWVNAYPLHVKEYDFVPRNSSMEKIAAEFLANPEKLWEYENPFDAYVKEPRGENGCDYVFKRKTLMGCRCDSLDIGLQSVMRPNERRCKFHNHVIFSDLLIQERNTIIF